MPRKTTLAATANRLRNISHGRLRRLPTRPAFVWSFLFLVFVFTNISIAEPYKIADRAGRGCSAPLWSPDDRFVAFTTIDQDELYAVEPINLKKLQKLYRVCKAEHVGRRFAFSPGEDRMVFRHMAGALKGAPDRIVSSSLFSYDPIMLSGNTSPIIGPYVIAGKVYYRNDSSSPYICVSGGEWPIQISISANRLVIKQKESEVYASTPHEKAVGYELSPDGLWVAAVLETESGDAVKLISTVDGHYLDVGKGRWPGWSGDSNRLIFVRDKPEIKYAELVVYDISIGQARSVQGLNQFWPDEPALNRDGTRIAFVHEGEVYVADVTGF